MSEKKCYYCGHTSLDVEECVSMPRCINRRECDERMELQIIHSDLPQNDGALLKHIKKLESDVERLKKALENYGEHEFSCPEYDKPYSSTVKCTCGLRSLFEGKEGGE
jgi:hypothetical protein